MVGIAEISAGLSSLNVLKTIVQGLDATRTAVITNEVKVDLLSRILDAQQALFVAQDGKRTDLQTIDELETEIVRLVDWSGEREKYELTRIRGGSSAYMLKEQYRGAEPPHWLCTNCYSNAKKSILQPQGSMRAGNSDVMWSCPNCKGSFATGHNTIPQWGGE